MTAQLGRQTHLAAVIGSPVAQSLSPTIHNAVFNARGLNWLYIAFHVAPGRARDALAAMATLGINGFSVTMPHKADVARAIDDVDDVVRITGAANTVVLSADSTLWATNTDGEGCCNALEAAMTSSLVGERAVVIGAGSTGAAVAYALVQRGVSDVAIINRSPGRAQDLVKRIGATTRVGKLSDISGARVIVNTTPAGMNTAGMNSAGMNTAGTPVDVSLLGSSHIVLDAVYHPLETAMLIGARAAGATVVDGLDMLVHQASLQQQHWIGERGDVSLMRSAALRELAQRQR